jgi:hypothetical protein
VGGLPWGHFGAERGGSGCVMNAAAHVFLQELYASALGMSLDRVPA